MVSVNYLCRHSLSTIIFLDLKNWVCVKGCRGYLGCDNTKIPGTAKKKWE